MNLYLISQYDNMGYDTYDSAVVVAKNEQEAREVHPSELVTHVSNGKWMGTYKRGELKGKEYVQDNIRGWVSFKDISCIKVELLGKTDKKKGLILASFNAG